MPTFGEINFRRMTRLTKFPLLLLLAILVAGVFSSCGSRRQEKVILPADFKGPKELSRLYGVRLTPDDNIYLYTDLGVGIPDTPVTLTGHLGYSDGSLAFGGNYWDWSVAADVTLGHGFTAGVKYVDTDLDDFTGIPAADTLYDATVLFTLGFSF